MRKRYGVDANQAAIVRALEAFGATVLVLAGVGDGAPDLLVGFRGQNYLLEVKALGEEPRANQVEWHGRWKGKPVAVVYDIGDALRAVGAVVAA